MSEASLATFAPPLSARDEIPEPAAAGGRRADPGPPMRRLLSLRLWLRRARERHRLERMALDYPSYLLRDVGLRREDLVREARKPFWRP